MVESGISYLFITPAFNNMMYIKSQLECDHSTLRCDIALNYNPKDDLSRYVLIAADIFSITKHPMELLTSLKYATHVPIAVLVPKTEIDAACKAAGTPDTFFKQLYNAGADIVLPLYLTDTIIAYFGSFYRRHVYFQHQEPIRHQSTMIFRDELVIRPKQREVSVRGQIIDLTAKEFEILNFLACNAGIVMTYDVIAERIWGSAEIVNSTIFSTITRLRRKIEADSQNPTYIQTIFGTGYIFKP